MVEQDAVRTEHLDAVGGEDGLRRYGALDQAAALRSAVIELARRSGFSEHYHAITGRGHGGAEFAWSAALVLDLIHEGGDEPGRR